MPLPVPPFYVSLQNFHHYQSNDLAYVSESFYSHPGGYKMCMCVRPNGSASFKGTHMGVYVAILRCEFDDKLRWPLFDGSVTIHIYNRTIQQWSNEKIIRMDKTGCNHRLGNLRLTDVWTNYHMVTGGIMTLYFSQSWKKIM